MSNNLQIGKERYYDAMIGLIATQPFYANLIMTMKLIFSDKAVPTAGVNVTDCPNLYINPDFFAGLTKKQAEAVLIHECLHLLHAHLHRFDLKGTNVIHKQMINVCMDAAINQLIQGLPDDCVTVEQLEKISGKHLLRHQAAEYYYQNMRDEADKMSEKLKELLENGTLDDHDIWNDGEPNEEVRKQVVRTAVQRAVDKSGGIGKISSDVALLIAQLNQNTVEWKHLIRNFIFRRTTQFKKNTRKKTNRRFGLDQPGYIRKRQMNLTVCMDTSGSVSDEALTQFYSEIDYINNFIPTIQIIEADCEVKYVKKYDPKKPKTVKGRGGTAYGPALEKSKELNSDLIIYFGDMDAGDRPNDPGIPVIWAVVGNGNPPADFGTIVRIPNL